MTKNIIRTTTVCVLTVVLGYLATSVSLRAEQSYIDQDSQIRRSGPPGLSRSGPVTYPPFDLSEMREELDGIRRDKNKLPVYAVYFMRAREVNQDSALIIMNEVESLKLSNDKLKTGYISFFKGYMNFANFDSSSFYHLRAKETLDPEFDQTTYVHNSIRLGRALVAKGKLVEAQTEYLDILKLMELEEGDRVGDPNLLSVYQGLGQLYTRAQASDLAINVYEKLLSFDPENEMRRCSILLSLSNAYTSNKEFEEAFSVLQPCGDNPEIRQPLKVGVLSTLGRLKGQMDDSDGAIMYYRQLVKLLEDETGPVPGLNFRRVFLAEAYLNDGNLSRADSIKNVIELNEERLRPDQELYKIVFYARLALALEEYREAVFYADQAIGYSKRINMEFRAQDIHEIKANAHEQLGEYEEALQAFRDYDYLNRLRTEMIEQRELANLNVRYQLTIRENELREASMTISKLSTNVKISLLGVVVVFLGALLVYYRNRVKFMVREEQTRNKIARDLHDDLSGTLSSISFFTEAAKRTETKADKASGYLSMIERSAVEAKEKINDIIWAIDPENDDWDRFVAKCKRFASDTLESKEIEYSIDLKIADPPALNLEQKQDIWLIFKELINNLVRHSEAAHAEIRLSVNAKEFRLMVSDDGIGLPESEQTEGNGIKNITYRVHRNNGVIERSKAEQDGLTWMITIPV